MVDLTKYPHETWRFSDKPEFRPRYGVVSITVWPSAAMAELDAEEGRKQGYHTQVREV
ncbi:hypothetical protein [Streptomyces sirii]|uniref:hypothetical protein n=1 Tax=Streptomyces sirii TaxID=3127701 RepID=UPI003D36693A